MCHLSPGPAGARGGAGQLPLRRCWMCSGRSGTGNGDRSARLRWGHCHARWGACVLSYYLLSRLVQPLEGFPLLFSFLSQSLFISFFFPPFLFLSLAVGTNWLTRIIQAAPACWGLCKWIWELLVSHDSNVHYWRWMFLKKRLMMDIRLIVPFIILNII